MKAVRNFFIRAFMLVGWIVFTLFGITGFVDFGYGLLLGKDEVYLITGNSTCIPIVLSIIVFAIFVWMFSPYGVFGHFEGDEEGVKANLPLNKKLLIAVTSVVLLFVGIIISMTCYEKFTLEGVERCRFGFVKEYTWEDVESFTLKDDIHNTLKFQIQMKDGSRHFFGGGAFRAAEYCSDGFEEAFPYEDGERYMLWLARKFGEADIPLKVKSWDKLIDRLTYPYWKEVAEEIRQEYENVK